jgi:hypothetical protein
MKVRFGPPPSVFLLIGHVQMRIIIGVAIAVIIVIIVVSIVKATGHGK